MLVSPVFALSQEGTTAQQQCPRRMPVDVVLRRTHMHTSTPQKSCTCVHRVQGVWAAAWWCPQRLRVCVIWVVGGDTHTHVVWQCLRQCCRKQCRHILHVVLCCTRTQPVDTQCTCGIFVAFHSCRAVTGEPRVGLLPLLMRLKPAACGSDVDTAGVAVAPHVLFGGCHSTAAVPTAPAGVCCVSRTHTHVHASVGSVVAGLGIVVGSSAGSVAVGCGAAGRSMVLCESPEEALPCSRVL